MSALPAKSAERVLEDRVRSLACPKCLRRPRKPCIGTEFSHTARYNAAAEAGLVSALRPIPSMEVWCACH